MSWVAIDMWYEGCGSHRCTVDHVYGPFDTKEAAEETAAKISRWPEDWRVIELEPTYVPVP